VALATKLLARVAEACAGADLIREVVKELSPPTTYASERARLAFHLRELFERMGTVQYDIMQMFDDRWEDDLAVQQFRPQYDDLSDAHQAIQIVRRVAGVLAESMSHPGADGWTKVQVSTEQWNALASAAKKFIERTRLEPIPAPEKPS
jgi:hypothetical protein